MKQESSVNSSTLPHKERKKYRAINLNKEIKERPNFSTDRKKEKEQRENITRLPKRRINKIEVEEMGI